MNKIIITIVFLAIAINGFSEWDIKLVKSLGDERNEYTFFDIRGATISENKEIYIIDYKGHSLSKFNFNGEFLKKVGKFGQGPGDFNRPNLIQAHNEHIYVHDSGNYRIVEIDYDLKVKNYYRLKEKFCLQLFVTSGDEFIGDFFMIKKNRGRIGAFDKSGNAVRDFFKETPIGSNINFNNRMLLAGLSSSSILKIAQSENNLLITFLLPNNPIQFYLYTKAGKSLRKFSYKIADQYKYPKHILRFPPKILEEDHHIRMNSLFYYKDYYIVFFHLVSFKKRKEIKNEAKMLVLDENGQKKIVKDVDNHYNFLFLSNNGYLLGKRKDDSSKLLIFKLVQ